MHSKPHKNIVPNADGEAALEEEMGRRLLALLTKWAEATVWPAATYEMIRCPNPVLKD